LFYQLHVTTISEYVMGEFPFADETN